MPSFKKMRKATFLTNFFPLRCVIYRMFIYTGDSFCGRCDACFTSPFFGFVLDSVSASWIIFGFKLLPILLLVVDEEMDDLSRWGLLFVAAFRAVGLQCIGKCPCHEKIQWIICQIFVKLRMSRVQTSWIKFFSLQCTPWRHTGNNCVAPDRIN